MDRGTEQMSDHSVSFFCRIKSGIVLSDKPKEVQTNPKEVSTSGQLTNRDGLPVGEAVGGWDGFDEGFEQDSPFTRLLGVFVGQKMQMSRVGDQAGADMRFGVSCA